MKTHFSDTKTNFSRRMLSTLRFMAAPVTFYFIMGDGLGRSDYRNIDDDSYLVVINQRTELFYQILLALSAPLGLIALCLTVVLAVIAAVAQAVFFLLECLIAKCRDHFVPKQPTIQPSDSRRGFNLADLHFLESSPQLIPGHPGRHVQLFKPSVFEEIFRDTTTPHLRQQDALDALAPPRSLNRTTTWVHIY